MTEIWKSVEGFDGYYEVSSLGNVRSVDRVIKSRWGTPMNKKGAPMKSRVGQTGYKYLNLSYENQHFTKKVHRLVAEAFCPNPENKPQINHKDGVKTNNHASNLEWVTGSENSLHAIRSGLQVASRGELSVNAKLKNNQIDHIRRMILESKKLTDIAEYFSTTVAVIKGIKSGRLWATVGSQKLLNECKSFSGRGINHPKRKLSDSDVAEIISRTSEGEGVKQVADDYNVHVSTVRSIKNRKSYLRIHEKIERDKTP